MSILGRRMIELCAESRLHQLFIHSEDLNELARKLVYDWDYVCNYAATLGIRVV
jgi:hypothetical protein